jgi:hypothetical protein
MAIGDGGGVLSTPDMFKVTRIRDAGESPPPALGLRYR